MTYRPAHLPQNGTDWKSLNNNSLWRWSDVLAAKAKFGPTATTLFSDPDIRPYLVPGLKLSETTQGDASAIGSLRTFWVLVPGDPDLGIWGVNTVSDDDLKAAQNAGLPMVTGFYMRIGSIPPPIVMRKKYASTGWFEDGFLAQYQSFYDPTALPPTALPSATPVAPIGTRYLELFVKEFGFKVPYDVGVNISDLQSGGLLGEIAQAGLSFDLLGDAPGDDRLGYKLSGPNGPIAKWVAYLVQTGELQSTNPADYGLPAFVGTYASGQGSTTGVRLLGRDELAQIGVLDRLQALYNTPFNP